MKCFTCQTTMVCYNDVNEISKRIDFLKCPNCRSNADIIYGNNGEYISRVDWRMGKTIQYTSKDMHIKINKNETLLQFIRNSEKEFGMDVACLGTMTDKEFNDYIDFLDDLWCK